MSRDRNDDKKKTKRELAKMVKGMIDEKKKELEEVDAQIAEIQRQKNEEAKKAEEAKKKKPWWKRC